MLRPRPVAPRPLAAMIALGVALASAADAHAALHLISITEVFPGAPAAPSAQYIELQMYAGGQTVVGGAFVVVYDASNAELGRFTFTANVPNGANQAQILIATTQAQTLFGVTANLTMTAILPRTGGKVCFESAGFGAIDCVAWGDHPGSAAGGGQVNVGPPLSPVLGLVPGRSAVRRLDVAGSPSVLEGTDDTNDSASNFGFGLPTPRNNANQSGTLPPSTCGNATVAGVEGCDDGNTTGGDGCSGACLVEACGDGATTGAETCDDANTTNGDGCDDNCRVTACGNGVRTGSEACDDGNLVSGDGCDNNCSLTACGNGVVVGAEVCDDGNLTSGDGCDGNCTPTGCGNGVVTLGEDCEPPGVGLCDAACQLPCTTDPECADADPCTTNERCTATGCAVDPVVIDDAQPCTMDACGAAGVVHDPVTDGTTCALPADPTRALCVAGVCGVARCGDGYVDPAAPGGAEQCDDGNAIDADACTNACTTPRCGDGVVHVGEACDDGNASDDDACTTACMAARCGDGFAQPGEGCDDGNTTSGDGCAATCAVERCGDGVEQLGEGCDDGNLAAGDGCSPACQVEGAPPLPVDDGGCCGTGARLGATTEVAAAP